jgi:hypothetical protein
VTATVDTFSGGRSNYSVGRLHIGIFSRKLGRVVLTYLSTCGAYARYSVSHPIGCLLGVMYIRFLWCNVWRPLPVMTSVCYNGSV